MGNAAAEVSSARELYDRDSTFRAGIAAWVEERRCDLRLVDLLLEYGLTTQADCARWAATEPDRPYRGTGPKSGPFPFVVGGEYYWYDCGEIGTVNETHDVPRARFGREVNYVTDTFKTPAEAILFLLDNWIPVPTGAVS